MLSLSQNLSCFALILFLLLCSPFIRKYSADFLDEISLRLILPFAFARSITYIRLMSLKKLSR